MDAKLKVDGIDYPLVTLDEMTMGERREVDRITGQQYDWGETLTATGMVALAYVAIKRENPLVRVSDLDAMKSDAFELVAGKDEPPVPPTSASASTESAGSSTETS